VKADLTRIGNSRGIRIPKPLIAECGLGDVVEMRVTPEGLVIAPYRAPRYGWKKALSAAHSDEPMLLGSAAVNEFDTEEWQW
jgi:antitoxin MazE